MKCVLRSGLDAKDAVELYRDGYCYNCPDDQYTNCLKEAITWLRQIEPTILRIEEADILNQFRGIKTDDLRALLEGTKHAAQGLGATGTNKQTLLFLIKQRALATMILNERRHQQEVKK